MEDNLSVNWKLFKLKWHNYAIITYLSRQLLQYQMALLLYTLGDEALKVYYGFQFLTPEDERTPTEIMQAFDKYALGEKNETYERYIFHTRKQGESETVESFITVLRMLVKTCNFCDNCVSSVLRDQVVLGIHNPQTQAELLKIRLLDLQRCLDICKLSENATVQSRILRPEGVNKVDFKPKRKTSAQTERECSACAPRHGPNKELCPAFGKTCNGKNHFAVKCKLSRKKRVQTVTTQQYDHENDSSSVSDYGQRNN